MDVTFGGKYRLEEEIANGGCGAYRRAVTLTDISPHYQVLSFWACIQLLARR